MAKRVTESISTSTSLPSSRKYSAIASVRWAAWRRIRAGSSEVDTTTTERFRPSSPRSSCRNSCTSRPRSPTSPITDTSATTLRASMESSTDLPTPDPAKMPMRCPRQQVMKALSARTPRSSGAPTRRREWAGGGVLRNGQGDGPAEPAGAGAHGAGDRRDDGAAAAPHPFERRERHEERVGPGEADHLAGDGRPLPGLDPDPRADRHGVDRPGDLDHEAAHADDAAIDLDPVQLGNLLGQSLHAK